MTNYIQFDFMSYLYGVESSTNDQSMDCPSWRQCDFIQDYHEMIQEATDLLAQMADPNPWW